jgi:hypothetical protein
MKLQRKVSTKEVKRCFAVGLLMNMQNGKMKHLIKVSRSEFFQKLTQAKRHALRLTEKQLNALITDPVRLAAYNASDWYLGTAQINELGVWTRAGEMPLAWTNRSLKETALKVKRNLTLHNWLSRTRARRALSNMLKTNVTDLQKEKYLLPIVFQGNTGTRGRWRLKHQTRGDIDDGSMRSIALAVSGEESLKVYIGVPKGAKITK